MSKLLKKLVFGLLAVVGAVVALLLLLIIGTAFYTHEEIPSTQDIKAVFFDKRMEYEERTAQIRKAIEANEKLDRDGDEILGYSRFSFKKEPFSVLYYTTNSGFGVGAFGAGIAYFEEVPDNLFASMEEMAEPAAEVEGFYGYGPIEGNWYYFRWEAD